VGRDSSVGTATRYGLDGPRIGSRWGRDFSHPSRPAQGPPPSLLYDGYRVSFLGVKRPGRGVDHPPSPSARIKQRVELYLYSPSGPSWPVLGRALPLPLPTCFIPSNEPPCPHNCVLNKQVKVVHTVHFDILYTITNNYCTIICVY
jgi:hypothetical protein